MGEGSVPGGHRTVRTEAIQYGRYREAGGTGAPGRKLDGLSAGPAMPDPGGASPASLTPRGDWHQHPPQMMGQTHMLASPTKGSQGGVPTISLSPSTSKALEFPEAREHVP